MLDKIRLMTGHLLIEVNFDPVDGLKDEGHLTIPDFGKKDDPCDIDTWIGKIVKVGNRRKDDENTFEPGEMVVCDRFAGEAIMIDGVYHRVIMYDDPVLVFTK